MPRLTTPSVPLIVQVAAGFRAAFLLGRGKEEGLRFAMLSMEGAGRSFWAAAICLVPFLLIRAMGDDSLREDTLAIELIGYVLGWVVFPLASLALADSAGRGALWPLFVSAWNWTNLVQYAVLFLATMLGQLLPGGGGVLVLGAFAYALWMEWFVAKTALKVSSGRAMAFVALDMAIGLLVASVVARLAG